MRRDYPKAILALPNRPRNPRHQLVKLILRTVEVYVPVIDEDDTRPASRLAIYGNPRSPAILLRDPDEEAFLGAPWVILEQGGSNLNFLDFVPDPIQADWTQPVRLPVDIETFQYFWKRRSGVVPIVKVCLLRKYSHEVHGPLALIVWRGQSRQEER